MTDRRSDQKQVSLPRIDAALKHDTANGPGNEYLITNSHSTSALNLEGDTPPTAAPSSITGPSGNLGWTAFKNTAAQVAGRSFIALSRLVVASIIARSYGTATFAEYSLIFGILTISEWLVDFGTTDVFVREVCREPERGPRLLRMLTAAKIVQIPAAFGLLLVILLVLRYPAPILESGLVGGTSLFFFGGVLVYRVLFKASLTMEREVAAELLSVLVMIPLIVLVAHQGWGLMALIGCHVVSRAAFFSLCFFFGGSRYRPSLAGISWHDVRWSLRSSAAIGAIGFLVVVYETMDLLLLAKLSNLSDLAYYSAAQRFVWPMLIALSSVGATLYPVAASYWPHARSQFQKACQRGVDTVFLIAGLAICSLLAGAEFFMGLLGPDLLVGTPVLRVLALLCFVKAISSAVGPVLYVVHAQKWALQFIAVAVFVKVAVIAALAPRFGALGVAFGALGVEICFSGIPVIYLIHQFTGYRVQWTVPLKVAILTLVTASAVRLLPSASGLLAALAAPALYVPLAFLSGAARLSDVRSILRWKPA